MARTRPPKASRQEPTLEERLAEARRQAEEPDRRAAELTAALTDAVAREDFMAAAGIREELTGARQEAALANATVTALTGALAEVERQAADEARAMQLHEQQADARHRLNAAYEAEQELLGELEAEVAAVWAGLETVKRTYQNAVHLEGRIGQLRGAQHHARVILGQAEAGQMVNKPNKASALPEYYPVIQAVVAWSR